MNESISRRGEVGTKQEEIGPRSRWPVVAVLVGALIVSSVARQWSMSLREQEVGRAAAIQIGGFDSYALALLLGGLRGPLVMALWTESETRKAERNLEGFDTQVEWIRLLQPEFDTVHIFQIWNKAYNISVQMASLSNKYTTILDAIEYANSVDAERPNNVNVLMALAQVWGQKLGNSFEREYYRARVRNETRHREVAPDPRRGSPGWRRTTLDPMVDAQGMLLPWARQRYPELVALEPFPYGLTPQAVGFAYYTRSQQLQASGRQRHLQLSDIVIDSRPSVALKFWSHEEWQNGRVAEILAVGLQPPAPDRVALDPVTAGMPLHARVYDREQLERARYSYRRSIQLVDIALPEYARHVAAFPRQLATFRSHTDAMTAHRAMLQGDYAFLQAMVSQGSERQAAIQRGIEAYARARELWALQILRYYISDEKAVRVFPQGVTRFTIAFDPAYPDRLSRMALEADRLERARADHMDFHLEARSEYLIYLTRCQMRLNTLGFGGQASAPTQPEAAQPEAGADVPTTSDAALSTAGPASTRG